MHPRAAVLIIGNEILTGKVQDKNILKLSQWLFAHGVALDKAVICRDVLDDIQNDLNALRQSYDFVFTSGGVGATHDDLTLEGIALAFGVKLEESQAMLQVIESIYGHDLTPRVRRMARVPHGAEVLVGEETRWPLIRIDNVFIFPGVPELFERKLHALSNYLPHSVTFTSLSLKLNCSENDVADVLEEVAHSFPDLFIGSYPRWNDPEYSVKVTVDGQHRERVDAAMRSLRERIPGPWIIA